MVARGGHVWLLPGGCMVAPRGGMCGCSRGGVGMHGFCWGACMVFAGGHVWFLPGGVHRIRRDTVNERVVRILLECILVDTKFTIRDH